ncbi:hypothetical protein PG993_010091 [Apiospora rasikravindrae]|uniref:ubiquitinyl hydrolase 1 n=1 Tax=Apiospora rasikravindrae TaxID=990691 RepID=A0ABR1SLB1_9PEZI
MQHSSYVAIFLWQQSEKIQHQSFSPWKQLIVYEDGAVSTWIVATLTSTIEGYKKQVIHYSYVEGYLLIDGKPFGKLPLEIRNSEDVAILFGNQNLLTSPSPLNGMSHQLVANTKGHNIHFGLRNGKAVISDVMADGLRESIPKKAFQTADSYDLPSSLLDECAHWLNISEGVLEIRQASKPWVARPSDWKVDIRTKRATRRRSTLVNPHGPLAAKIGRIFQGFENPRRLTIFQPEKGRLSVELKHLDLLFFVNDNKLLESRELGLEIGQDQDIQTLQWRRRGIHSEVIAKANNDYYKFSVDRILGRLTCAPEPGQLLFKGLLHTLTSFVLPDDLTGRTGTEEAFALLASGQCQPWQPLDPKTISVIQTLATLGPLREYYPSDKRHLQKVVWKKDLSPTAQNDFFYTAVYRVASKSNQLCDFSLKGSDGKFDLRDCHSHLRKRGKVQSTRYQRTNDITKLFAKGKDCVYESRDRNASSRAARTYHISSIGWGLQLKVNTSRQLKSIMSSWGLVGGFKDTSSESSTTLGSLIEDHMSPNWGAHLQFCKSTYPSERFKLLFRLSMLAFSEKADMGMIKMFAALGRVKNLSDLPTPPGSSFSITEDGIQPNEDELVRLLASSCPKKIYGQDLDTSLKAYKARPDESHKPPIPKSIDPDSIRAAIQTSMDVITTMLSSIKRACAQGDQRSHWLELTTLWPSVTPITILEQLRSTAHVNLSHSMKEAIVGYGMSIAILQKYRRMLDAALNKLGDHILAEEYYNIGHQNWKPMENPEWLLMQIDTDILIRPEQVDVADAIIAKESTANYVLQLNMGKGKTSVILPMAAAILANKTQLARLIVPKSLLLQTAQILQSRIGVLVGRPIMHIPFSRRTPTSLPMVALYEELHKLLMVSRGIMITTPESVLSFKLSGLQNLRDCKLTTASELVAMQGWMSRYCRDVLDESDFTLSVKTQLIYPSGSQEALDGHPHRWLIAQNILALVEDCLIDVKYRHPKGITAIRRGNVYPTVHFLNVQTEECLKTLLIQQVATGNLVGLRFSSHINSSASVGVPEVLSSSDFDSGRILELSRCFTDPQTAFKCLHLLRGLLRNNILISCLKKRWNVQYGLHESRDPIAVPFEAKGIPHPQAEFGHPDAAIVLTYDPAAEFDRWTGGCGGTPETLRNVNNINSEDEKQMRSLWRYMRYNRNVLDHFMNNFVFPNHARQFSVKLQASGWDLPQFSPTGNHQKSSGFSGTNDNKSMLPLTIHQKDLPALHHTNAEVLTYLLQPGNRGYVTTMDATTQKAWTEQQLLHAIHGKGIGVFIDAGAYILHMDNKTVAGQWLGVDKQAKAAVYFGDDNRAWVKYRENRKADAPLLATPFADKLEDCLVYLDQAHTRGTDMKLPPSAKGALTLSLGQTKDSTVQAAMRLRQLKTTQSLLFVAPPEVHLSIQDVCKKDSKQHINSADVVYWLLEQTCASNEQLRGLFFAQGQDFCRRMDSAHRNKDFLVNKQQRIEYLKVLEQPERQILEDMYGTRSATVAQTATYSEEAITKSPSQKLNDIATELCTKRVSVNAYSFLDVLGEVEHEREVEFQVEEVRDIHKPVRYKALVFPGLHQDLHEFVASGELRPRSSFRHASTVTGATEIGAKHRLSQSSTRLFVSTEFEQTIELVRGERNDSFMRPVEWILWSPSSETGIVIIREEAENLLSSLRGQVHPKVYLLTYAAPVTKVMETLGRMSFYTIPTLPSGYEFPAWLPSEVGIFAGRLYLDFDSWVAIAHQLRARSAKEEGHQEHVQFPADDPRGFLLDCLTFRRRGQNILHTPMGYLCQGRQLTRDHAFFSEASVGAAPPTEPTDSDSSASEMDEIESLDDSSSGEESQEERDGTCNVV